MTVLTGCGVELSPTPTPSPTLTGPAVLLDTRIPGWQTSAWLAGDKFCVRAARTPPIKGNMDNEYVSCDPAPASLSRAGPPLIPARPAPSVWPLDPAQRDLIVIGAVRGAIAEVTVTVFGRSFTAPIHELPVSGGRSVGAYAVWIPWSGPGGDGFQDEDITSVTGRDSTGQVVARLD